MPADSRRLAPGTATPPAVTRPAITRGGKPDIAAQAGSTRSPRSAAAIAPVASNAGGPGGRGPPEGAAMPAGAGRSEDPAAFDAAVWTEPRAPITSRATNAAIPPRPAPATSG